MKLSIVSPGGSGFEGTIESLTVDSLGGQLTILPLHADFLAFFDMTEIRVITTDATRFDDLWACDGYVQVNGAHVYVIAQFTSSCEAEVREVRQHLASVRGSS
ncbi:hypothetical protein [Leifsonia aquatica]|uniref:hypothetical protein n=1 Tax=Leifsonia aquatica TaxID=144185 RepID=UPI00382290F7